MLGVALMTLAVNIYMFYITPKGFFPEQDNGRLVGAVVADQDTSFQAMNRRLKRLIKAVLGDPNVDNVLAFTGTNGATNTATMYVDLKPRGQRKLSAQQVIAQIRKQSREAGRSEPLPAGATGPAYRRQIGERRISVHADEQRSRLTDELGAETAREIARYPQLTDVSSDQQNAGTRRQS